MLRLIVLTVVLLASSLEAYPSLRMTGVLRHDRIQRDQLVKLDLIGTTDEAGKPELMGILTLQFGDFTSNEYVSFHFDHILYEPSTGWMVFDQTNQEARVAISKFSFDGFEGSLRSNFSDEPVQLILKRDGQVPLKYPLIESIWGEYAGTCNKVPTVIQLYTFRSIEDTSKIGHPFADYEIRGALATQDKDLCVDIPCVRNNFYSGAYNFFKEQLTLNGRQGVVNCTTTPTGMKCSGCSFKRVSGEMKEPRAYKQPTSENENVVDSKDVSAKDLDGFYSGYLHHEALNQYQTASLNILALPSSSGDTMISTLAKLYFGDLQSQETLAYRYEPLVVSDISKGFLLKRPESDVDAILEVTSFKKGVIKGVWYSLLFGRVGTFELSRKGVKPLSEKFKTFESIEGSYTSPLFDLELGVSAVKTPLNTENPFFPLTFDGYWYNPQTFSAKKVIRGGSYDFYTGRFAMFMTEDERYLVGNRFDSKNIQLKYSTSASGALLLPHALTVFTRKN